MLSFLPILVTQCATWTRAEPPHLRTITEARAAITTAQVHWDMSRPAVEGGRRYRYMSQVGGEDLILAEFGDERGVYMYREVDGKRVPDPAPPLRWLRVGEEVWEYTDDDLIARVYDSDSAPAMMDIRSLGLTPMPALVRPWHEWQVRSDGSPGTPEYCVEWEGELTVVSMRDVDQPDEVTRWVLDARFGNQPVRCEMLHEGKVIRAVHTTYRQLSDGSRSTGRAGRFRSKHNVIA